MEFDTQQSLLESILDHQSEMICLFQLDGKILFANQSFCKLHSCSKDDILGREFKEFLVQNQRQRLDEHIKFLKHKSEPIYIEQQVHFANGQRAWQRWQLSPIVDKEGKLLRVQASIRDISNEKKLKNEVQELTQKFVNLYENLSYPLILLNPDHSIQALNKFARTVLKQVWGKEGQIGQNFTEYLPDQDMYTFVLDFDRALSGEIIHREREVESRLNRSIWFEFNFSPVQDEFGNIRYVSLALQNISQRKSLEESIKVRGSQKLIQSDQKPVPANLAKQYLNFVNYLPNGGLLVFDQKLSCQFLGGEALYKLGHKEAQGQKLREIFPNALNVDIDEKLKSALLGDSSTFELKYLNEFYHVQVAPISDATLQVREVCMTLLNISEVKLSEQSLKKSEETLLNYLDNAPEGIWILDRNGRIQYVNQVALDLVAAEEVRELKFQPFTNFLTKNERSYTWTRFAHDSEVSPLGLDCEIKAYNHLSTPVWVHLKPVSDQSYICFTRDMSEIKSTENQLKLATQKAESRAQQQTEFLSTMSHEIRTPMNAVIALTYLLLQENPRPEQVKHLNTLKFSAENLLVLINDILDYDKIESGKLTLEKTDFDLTELLHSITETLRFKAKNKRIKIVESIQPDVPEIFIGDPVRLAQILTNLMDNAIKFTSEGEVRVEVRSERLSKKEFALDFSIKDTGIGIAEDKLRAIFDKFTQASDATTRIFGGSGLGLAITKRLVELQGGNIHVESKPGLGSTFYFRINFELGSRRNLQKHKSSHLNPAFDAFDQSLNQARVLLVEDNEMNQMVVSQFLEKWQAQVDYAHNGEIAIELLEKNEYDVVLMDLEMPVMNGFQTTEKIRNLHARFQNIPIIALTASAMSEVRAKVLAAGMNDYLTKPFQPRALFEVIHRNLKESPVLDIKKHSSPSLEKQTQAPKTLVNIDYGKIMEISGGNKAFIRKYNELARKVFRTLPDDLTYVLLHRDLEKLRRIHHDMRATIGLLDLNDLERTMQSAREILEEEIYEDEPIQVIIQDVKDLCLTYLEYLDNHF